MMEADWAEREMETRRANRVATMRMRELVEYREKGSASAEYQRQIYRGIVAALVLFRRAERGKARATKPSGFLVSGFLGFWFPGFWVSGFLVSGFLDGACNIELIEVSDIRFLVVFLDDFGGLLWAFICCSS